MVKTCWGEVWHTHQSSACPIADEAMQPDEDDEDEMDKVLAAKKIKAGALGYLEVVYLLWEWAHQDVNIN